MPTYPDDYQIVHVRLTKAEYNRLRLASYVLEHPTVESLLRIKAGLPGRAYGLKGALARARAKAERGDVD